MFFIIPVLLIINTPGLNLEPTPRPLPQLDLPPLPPASSAKPQVLLNSYAEGRDHSPQQQQDYSRYDRDRSNRFGPPYGGGRGNNDDDDDIRTERVRERDRERERERERDRYNADRERERERDRYNADRDRDRNQRPYQYDDRNRYNINNDGPNNNNNYNINNNNNNNNYNNDDRYQLEFERNERARNEALRAVLNEIDKKSSHECSQNVAAQWLFETNVNEGTQLEAIAAQQRYSDFQRTLWVQMSQIDKSSVYDPLLFRQVSLMSTIGPSALPPDQLDRYNRLVNDMLAIYNGASICAYEQPFKCGLRLQPHLKEIMAKSRDWDELQYVWLEWRRKSGRKIRDLFDQMVDLTNEAARYNNFTNAAEYWMSPFDSINIRADTEDAWSAIQPLYEMIHTYVRRKLREFYGPDKISRDAPLPDHVLGNMYGQSWANILDITIPYPGRSFLEVTPEMNAQGYTPAVMFQIAEEFFVSMNMTALPPDFWINSIVEEPVDRVVLCQPSAWDFCTGQDYRIKMCTHVTHKDLITVHHEMAHIQYFINYRQLPKVFRDGANPGFHEAIGDAIGLSVATPKHLQKLGLVHKSVDDTAHDVNFLFALAMDKVVFLPFALSLETWRLDIFDKKINKDQYNCHWWLLRERYGGIKPPVLRSELDFDPGSKYHVPANIPYMRYVIYALLLSN